MEGFNKVTGRRLSEGALEFTDVAHGAGDGKTE